STAFGKSDGMRNTEANGGRQPAGIRARDGKLWFPTQDGVAIFDPEAVGFNPLPPPVVIESVKIDNILSAPPTPVDSADITINPDQRNFEIQYTALSFIKPEQIRFRYRMEGLDADWTEAGRRRTAYFTHLPPGEYTFRVLAANSDGSWNERGASVKIVVLPPFYRTWWFIALTTLAISAAATLAYRRRISQLEQRRVAQQNFSRQLIASQEQERKRIAVELHDSLGQSLVIIRNWALLGAGQLDAEAPAKEELDEISTTASRAINEVREIAYNLGPYHLDRLGLANTVKDMVGRVAQASKIRFTTDLEQLDGALSREVEMNLYRIAQEAINNLVKHSGATEAKVEIRREADAVKLMISDNGKGFDPQAAVTSADKAGFGLTGMAERVRLLDGAWAVHSAPGRGTTIVVTVVSGGRG
ncbi:MAG: histidine kinase, partial [Acidobacteriota bacterium]|nr:histidine kinase [Acidobacteriota bacterium]